MGFGLSGVMPSGVLSVYLIISSIIVLPLFRHAGRNRLTLEICELNHSGDWINSELFSGVLLRQKSDHFV